MGWVGQAHTFWKRFRPPWNLIRETLADSAIALSQTGEKNSSEIKKIKESSLWWAILNAAKTYFSKSP